VSPLPAADPLAPALTHLRAADATLAGVIEAVGAFDLAAPRPGEAPPADHYGALVRSIVGQQVSVAAARAIYLRLVERSGGRTPTPAEVVAADPDELRGAGLSRAKVASLRSLAEHVLSGALELDRLEQLPDEVVLAELVAVRGIGAWTAQMFLMFRLQRPDVLPTGDVGIQRAVQLAYALAERPDAAQLAAIAAPWRPWRTVACRYLWRSLAITPA